MGDILRRPIELNNVKQFGVFDHFTADQSDLFFVDTITDTGTALVNDAVNGVMVLTPSDGTVADNDEVYLATANEIFLFKEDKPMLAIARVKFVETTSGVFNCFMGFCDAIAANTLVDNGGGMKSGNSIAAIYKVDGETVWRCVTRNNGTSTITQSTTTAGGSSYQVLEIEVLSFSTTQVQVVFRCDGIPLRDSNGRDIVHKITVASATEMQFGFGAKLGAATNNDTLSIDYAGAWQMCH